MAESIRTALTILRRKQLQIRTGLSRSTIYDRLDINSPRYDPDFPKPVRLGGHAVGWIESEIEAWLELQIARRSPVSLPQQVIHVLNSTNVSYAKPPKTLASPLKISM